MTFSSTLEHVLGLLVFDLKTTQHDGLEHAKMEISSNPVWHLPSSETEVTCVKLLNY